MEKYVLLTWKYASPWSEETNIKVKLTVDEEFQSNLLDNLSHGSYVQIVIFVNNLLF